MLPYFYTYSGTSGTSVNDILYAWLVYSIIKIFTDWFMGFGVFAIIISIITVLYLFVLYPHTVIKNETNIDLFWKCGVHFYWKKIIYIDVYFFLQGKNLQNMGL